MQHFKVGDKVAYVEVEERIFEVIDVTDRPARFGPSMGDLEPRELVYRIKSGKQVWEAISAELSLAPGRHRKPWDELTPVQRTGLSLADIWIDQGLAHDLGMDQERVETSSKDRLMRRWTEKYGATS